MHYFRVPREYWKDRFRKMKECGFNAVETYIAWNIHEKEKGRFDFTGMLDVEEYLRTAQEEGLWAIVRPGPYICSEWEAGGLPWWLFTEKDIRLRCMNDRYLEAVSSFFDELMPRLAHMQSTQGGPILMMQCENEYGSYGDDSEYITWTRDAMLRRGINVPLFTSDGPTDFMLTGGTIPSLLKTGNFGSHAAEQFKKLREFQPEGPLMCCEYWNGWFDHWTETHHTRDPKDAAQVLDDILACGASVSAYMFHGGTNFGLWNGANHYDVYQPTVNSYDDDAPVNECGDLTEKYYLFRDVISRYRDVPALTAEKNVPKANYGRIAFTESCRLFDCLDSISQGIRCTCPEPMEKLGQGYGYTLYSCDVRGPREEMPLTIQEIHDRAHIYANQSFAGIQYRAEPNAEKPKLRIPAEGLRLDILAENMGRTNYGYHMTELKGITEGVRLGQQFLFHWKAYPLPMDDITRVPFKPGVSKFDGTPVFLKGSFDILSEPRDTFVKLPGFTKGIIFINGKLLSRYWAVGPQRSAYLPAPWLKKGKNEIVIFETDGFETPEALLDDTPDLG
ncbi:MAG: beta-galactosidase [Clostridia bacterium]|nr:beta-galactosidase [Clostridia bacterium]